MKYKSKAELCGGIILILIGTKIPAGRTENDINNNYKISTQTCYNTTINEQA